MFKLTIGTNLQKARARAETASAPKDDSTPDPGAPSAEISTEPSTSASKEKSAHAFHSSPEEILNPKAPTAAKSGVVKIPRVTNPIAGGSAENADENVSEDANATADENGGGGGRPKGAGWKKNKDRRGPRGGKAGPNAGRNAHNQRANEQVATGTNSLGAAKSVIRNKLSVMYRGMRGLDAAQEAFRLCNVDIELNVQDPQPKAQQFGKRKRPFKGKNPRQPAADVNAKKSKNSDDASKNGSTSNETGSDA